MRIAMLAAAMVGLMAAPAAAESKRVYLSGQLAVNAGSRGPIDVGTFPTVGALIGLRVSDAWSVEFEIDRGFGESKERVFEGLLLAQLTGPGPFSDEERARRGVFGRSVHRSSVASGYSAHVVWKTRDPGRVNAALIGGLSLRKFERVREVDITSVGPDVTYPPDHVNLRDVVETRAIGGAGFTAGVMVPVRVGSSLTIGPELRVTAGLITDESTYLVFHTGLRVMWGL